MVHSILTLLIILLHLHNCTVVFSVHSLKAVVVVMFLCC